MKVADLYEYLPHRPPAIWIDEVGEVTDAKGECFVDLKVDAAYFAPTSSGVTLRRTSLIEFIAQSFGYQVVAKTIREGGTPNKSSKAFLVSVTKCVLEDLTSLKPGTRLTVTITGVKHVGPITLFNSEVTEANGAVFARASLKVFAE